ncbi:hypothetical protein AMS68_004646 [Peltaster fructicola]|uniref:Uncharacterized protein n=1 Tax=Peltaster fructicola TaxID=286661 RepID=A0A6H0XWY5_9PEZI|nr:hypothetical protein AMS68_004646 [Peltaster fructicola]
MAQQAPQKEDWTFFFNFDAGETPQSQESNNNIIATPGELSHEEIELRSAESSDRYPASPGHPSFEGSLQELEAFGDIVGLDVDPEALDNMVDPAFDAQALDDMMGPGFDEAAFNSMVGPRVDTGALNYTRVPGIYPEPLDDMMGLGVNPSMTSRAPPVHMNSIRCADSSALLPAFPPMSGVSLFGFGGQYQSMHAMPQAGRPVESFNPAASNGLFLSFNSMSQGPHQQHMPLTVVPRPRFTPPEQSMMQTAPAPLYNYSRRADQPVPIAPMQRASRHELTAKERKRMAKEANNRAKRVERQQ